MLKPLPKTGAAFLFTKHINVESKPVTKLRRIAAPGRHFPCTGHGNSLLPCDRHGVNYCQRAVFGAAPACEQIKFPVLSLLPGNSATEPAAISWSAPGLLPLLPL